jgi:putative transposase
MPRPNRLVAAGYPHHVIRRGNNRQAIFFEDADRGVFLSALGEALEAYQCALHAMG